MPDPSSACWILEVIDTVEWKGLAGETNQGKGLVSYVNTPVITKSAGVKFEIEEGTMKEWNDVETELDYIHYISKLHLITALLCCPKQAW